MGENFKNVNVSIEYLVHRGMNKSAKSNAAVFRSWPCKDVSFTVFIGFKMKMNLYEIYFQNFPLIEAFHTT